MLSSSGSMESHLAKLEIGSVYVHDTFPYLPSSC